MGVEESEPQVAPPSPAGAPVGEGPWEGNLVATKHRYSNGCVDHRELTIAALKLENDVRMPVILGFEGGHDGWRGEPRFLRPDFFSARCVNVRGSLITYAHQGYSGSPAWAIKADHIEPIPCH